MARGAALELELTESILIQDVEDTLARLHALAGLGVRGVHGTTEIFGRALRLAQTGNLQTYAFLFALGVASGS